MTNNELRKLQKAEPFKPFDIHLANGRQVHVPHPDFIYIPPVTDRTVIVTDEDGVPEIINVLVIVSVKISKGGNGQQRRRKAG